MITSYHHAFSTIRVMNFKAHNELINYQNILSFKFLFLQ